MAGVVIAGTILADKINEISAYPQAGELTQILRVSRAAGGCVPNTAVDLKKLRPEIEVKAAGLVGDDADGEFVTRALADCGVDVAGVKTVCGARTSFTDVMSVRGGQRTFFTYAGVNAAFSAADVDFDVLNADMLHLGYFLLLDAVDNGEGLKILKAAKARGIKTSVDLVSENSERYPLVLPCLPYVDNLIVNETEAARLAGENPAVKNLPAIAEKLLALGVRERVIVHCPEAGVCVSARGTVSVPSFDLPEGFIKGTTGAGDAFCAGALLGIYEGADDGEILQTATVAAAAALSAADATGGMTSLDGARKMCAHFKRRKTCL
ncbi:MAG: hypothetical protein DBX59_02720 [Bacillota bacterium]|nr:MAG: hypothetical protein DBX59_02720 [Bacillota bacterium]